MKEPSTPEVLAWLHAQLAKAEQSLRARQQMSQTWKSGDSKSWRRAGCKLTKAERERVSEKHARISITCERDVAMCRAAISALENIK